MSNEMTEKNETRNRPLYHLYALRAGDAPSDTEFYFLLPEIDLVYTQEKPEKAVEITNPEQIPAAAREWLLQTISVLTERYLTESDGAVKGSRSFMDRFARELEIERVKEHGTEHGA